MNYRKIAFALCFTAFSGVAANAAPAKCSKINLTHCLDSVCNINGAINPAARCQYCGTANAGEPLKKSGLTNITTGQSAKYTLNDKELKLAPNDPGQRYIWATQECIKKISECTTDDVSNAYDKLIEQSCKAAGVSAKITVANANLNKKVSKTQCDNTITVCITKECGSYFENCSDQADFDRSFSKCSTEATGCGDYLADFKKKHDTARLNSTETREKSLLALVEKYKTTRENKIAAAREACKKKTANTSCVERICAENMKNKCEKKNEKVMAEQFCKYIDRACEFLK
ncbi:MAG: hypothetical protein K5912_01850 [Alphaproteobacteria bacterium]|nr:hypothetical protein [Alphaproteobacteria bacterium]